MIDAADAALQRLRAVQPSSQGSVMTGPWKKVADEAWDCKLARGSPPGIAKPVVVVS